MSQIKTLANALALTATGIGTPERLDTTPFNGGMGREAILNLSNAPGGAAVVLIQGHSDPRNDVPAEADTGWYTVATLNSASPLRQEIPDLPAWIRVNRSVVGTGTLTIQLEGTP